MTSVHVGQNALLVYLDGSSRWRSGKEIKSKGG